MLHAEDSKFYGFASALPEIPEEERAPMKITEGLAQVLNELPIYRKFETQVLMQMAAEKLTYTRKSGSLAGRTIRTISINDRAKAIAVLLGPASLDSPRLQLELEPPAATGEPRYA